jgi:hypothetical protein
MEGDVSNDYGIILESMGRVSRLTSLVTVMNAGLPKLLASSGYKSQRKNCNREGEERRERRGYREEKKKEGDSLLELKKSERAEK